MPQELGDVLHYFLPESERDAPRRQRITRTAEPSADRPVPERPAALPIVALPIGEQDVVRAAFAWNLTVEIARLGASASLVAPRDESAATLWPSEGRGPLGAELVLSAAGGLGELARAALDVAVDRAADAADGGVVLVRVPPDWLRDGREGRVLLRHVLLFAATDSRDLLEAYGLAKQVLCTSGEAEVGVTIHGARRISEAERAFRRVAGVAARHLGRELVSYGLLVDDLHIYRAIVARRPIGLEHPQSSAARALRDVAQLLLEDMRKKALA